jgi:hypothetical protein
MPLSHDLNGANDLTIYEVFVKSFKSFNVFKKGIPISFEIESHRNPANLQMPSANDLKYLIFFLIARPLLSQGRTHWGCQGRPDPV